MQPVLYHIVSNVIDGFYAGDNAVLPGAQNGSELVTAGRRQRVAQVGLNGRNGELRYVKGLRQLTHDRRFGDTILWCARTVSVHVGAVAQSYFTQHRAG